MAKKDLKSGLNKIIKPNADDIYQSKEKVQLADESFIAEAERVHQEMMKNPGNAGAAAMASLQKAAGQLKKKDAAPMPREEDYLENADLYLPFSTLLRADQYLKLKRCEYWNRVSIREVFEKLLDEGLKQYPNLNKELPEKVIAKLKPLKTANDYYADRTSNKSGKSGE